MGRGTLWAGVFAEHISDEPRVMNFSSVVMRQGTLGLSKDRSQDA